MTRVGWLIILTHRRGGAVVAAKPGTAVLTHGDKGLGYGRLPDADIIGMLADWGYERLWLSERLAAKGQEAALVQGVATLLGPISFENPRAAIPGLAVTISEAPTAESLRSIVLETLDAAGMTSAEVGELGYGAGPEGSFTGLRLGASFAAGFTLGRNVALVPLATLTRPRELDAAEGRLRDVAIGVAPAEVLAAVVSLLWDPRPVEEPGTVRYRSDPGPVLVLRGQSR